jgi:hypothetical protein
MAELLELALMAMIRRAGHLDALFDSPLANALKNALTELQAQPSLRFIVQHPEIALAVAFAFVVAVLPIALIFAAHWVIGRRRARVFISFQHDREPVADAVASEMARSKIDQVKLPFLENPDHDLLLDQVRKSIRDCDVFVCIPGSRPSFVESEVSMAFGLGKPLVFVLIEADIPRLPNTPKKGYPMFSLEQLQRDGFCTLVKFCSYLAADWRSTVQLYFAVLAHWGRCASLLPAIIIVSLLVMMGVTELMGASSDFEPIDLRGPLLRQVNFVLYPPILSMMTAIWVLFFTLYSIFTLTRRSLRTRIKQAISSKKFNESFLPKTLDYSLTRGALLTMLYGGDLLAAHESKAPKAQNA